MKLNQCEKLMSFDVFVIILQLDINMQELKSVFTQLYCPQVMQNEIWIIYIQLGISLAPCNEKCNLTLYRIASKNL